jgi:DNA-binding Lrp family transcriptional regulator
VDPDAPLDRTDLGLLHALQLDPRLPFSRIAQVLDVSDQTVARRYRRLCAAGTVRVTALVNPWQLGQAPWFVRLQCVPTAAAGIAAALVARPDTGWVYLISGGAEIDCTVLPRTAEEHTLLLQRLTRTSRVVAVSAHSVLRIFPASVRHVIGPVLSADQIAALGAEPAAVPAAAAGGPGRIGPEDRVLVDALSQDARAPLADLARATGWSESAVRRRLETLRRTSAVFFEVDIDPAHLGYAVHARLWITAAPADLAAVGEAVAAHPRVPFAGATTGATNVIATVYCRDAAALYDLLTGDLGTMPGIRHIETALIVRTLKRAGRVLS